MGHVLFCSDQLDGVAAAAIMGRMLRLRGREWRLGGTLSHASESGVALLAQTKNAILHLLDVSPDYLVPFEQTVSSLAANNKIAYWCSDLPCAEETAGIIKGVSAAADIITHRSPLCSAELAQQRFLPNDSTALQLAALAHDIKLWRRHDETALRLADVIASGYDRRSIVDALSKGVLWSATLQAARDAYLEKKEKALAELNKHIIIKDYVGAKFGFTLAANLLPSADACQHLLDTHAGVDVAVVVYRDRRIVFRRREGIDVDLARVAKVFDGGGREYASGGRLRTGESVTAESFERVVFGIDRTLKDFFLR